MPRAAGRGPTSRALLAASMVVAPLLGLAWVSHDSRHLVDFLVYRSGASTLLDDGGLYRAAPGLPFTYPPFAAVLLAPFAVLHRPLADVAWLAVTWGSYVAFVLLLARRTGLTGRRRSVLLLAGGLLLEPVWHTVVLGQINLAVAALVVVDVLVVPNRWRGLGVGVAAGVKLTPAVFVLYFAVRREWAAMARAGVGLLLTVGLGAVADRDDSTAFWTHAFYSPDHVGGVSYAGNQSVLGVLTRLLHTEHPPTWSYLALALPCLGLAVVAARRQAGAGADVAALTCIAVGGLLVSPISWSHHWVWLVPAVLVLTSGGHRVAAAVVALAALVAPMRFLPRGAGVELHQPWWQQLLCTTYVVAGLVFLVVMVARRRPRRADGSAPARTR